MPKRFTYLWAALAASAAVCSCGQPADPQSQFRGRQQQMPAVEAVQVMYGSLPLEERLAGSVRARNQTDIFAEVSGTIEAVFVDDGDRVSAGDPLVRLRARDFEERVRQAESGLQVADARVRQAEANLARATASLERVQTIVERGLGAGAELDTARADAISADADLALAQAQRNQAASVVEERLTELEETVIRAPIEGIVGARNAEVGAQANTNTSLFTIGDIELMQVDVTLTQQMLGRIDTGTSVNIYSDTAPGDVLTASISRVSPYLHPVTHTTNAEIHVDAQGGRLRPGMFVTVDVLYGETEQAPLVPNSAVYRHPRDGRVGVFLAAIDEALRNPEVSEQAPLGPLQLGEPLGPVTVRFVPVSVVARGRVSSAIDGVEQGQWVVTLGHRLLASADEGQAIVQPTAWEHILELQQMQSRDLLEVIRDKQQQGEAESLEPN
jgi:RND family efflux transporter MFP subunit